MYGTLAQPPTNWSLVESVSPTDTVNSPINAHPLFSEFTTSTYKSVPSDSIWNVDSYFKQESGNCSSFASPTPDYHPAFTSTSVTDAPASFMSAGPAMDEDEDDMSDTANKTFLQREGSISSLQTANEISQSLQTPHEESWGEMSMPNKIQSSSKRHPLRTKTHQQDQSRSRDNSSSSSAIGHQLRSIRLRPNFEVEAQTPESMTGSRASHNVVERNYRTRLNNQFSHLLEVLPVDMIAAETGAGSMNSNDQDKKTSKGEILLLARRYIMNMAESKRTLEAENVEMEAEIRRLRSALSKKGVDSLDMASFVGMK